MKNLILGCLLLTTLSACTDKQLYTFDKELLILQSGVNLWNLETGEIKEIIKTDRSFIESFDLLDDKTILTQIYDPRTAVNSLSLWGFNGLKIRELGVGKSPSYFNFNDSIVFYNSQNRLSVMSVNNEFKEYSISDFSHSYFQNVTKISERSFLYSNKTSNSESEFFKFSFETGKSHPVDFLNRCDPIGILWIAQQNSFFCATKETSGDGNKNYLLIGENGTVNESVQDLDGYRILGTLDKGENLIVTKVEFNYLNFSEEHSVYLYSFKSRKLKLISHSLMIYENLRQLPYKRDQGTSWTPTTF